MIGEKIALCRKKAGMSQEALAAELNISRQAVSRWETGEATPDTDKVVQLSRLFGVTTDYLLGREDQRSVDLSGLTAAEATLICDLVSSMTAKNKRMEDYL